MSVIGWFVIFVMAVLMVLEWMFTKRVVKHQKETIILIGGIIDTLAELSIKQAIHENQENLANRIQDIKDDVKKTMNDSKEG